MNAPDGLDRRGQKGNVPAAALLLVSFMTMFPAFAARADIYRWVDEQGTIHFTDDLSSIPPPFRDKARPVVREAPGSKPAPGAPEIPAATPKPSQPRPRPSEPAPGETREKQREALASQIEQLQAKIEAKEKLIRQVDEKRSLATNPYRNRFVDPVDLDLYDKYQAELPQDRERLKGLESRLESLK